MSRFDEAFIALMAAVLVVDVAAAWLADRRLRALVAHLQDLNAMILMGVTISPASERDAS